MAMGPIAGQGARDVGNFLGNMLGFLLTGQGSGTAVPGGQPVVQPGAPVAGASVVAPPATVPVAAPAVKPASTQSATKPSGAYLPWNAGVGLWEPPAKGTGKTSAPANPTTFSPQPAAEVRSNPAMPTTMEVPGGMPTSPGGLGFGMGDIFNMFAHPVQGGLGTGILGLLGGLGNFMTNPANQYMMGSMLASGAPQGTWPQMMGQNFAGQASNILNWQALGSLLGGGNGQPQVGGQPQMGAQPNFPNSNGPAAASPFASAIMSGAVNPAILTQAANIGAQQQETQQRQQALELEQQAAPTQNLLRLMQAYSMSPQSMEKKAALEMAIDENRAKFAPRYSYQTEVLGDRIVLIRTDNRGSRPEPVMSWRNTPDAKQQAEMVRLQKEVDEISRARYEHAGRIMNYFADANKNPLTGQITPEAAKLLPVVFNDALQRQGVDLGTSPFQNTGGVTASPFNDLMQK